MAKQKKLTDIEMLSCMIEYLSEDIKNLTSEVRTLTSEMENLRQQNSKKISIPNNHKIQIKDIIANGRHELSTRTLNALYNEGVDNYLDWSDPYTFRYLLRVPNLGRKSVTQLQAFCESKLIGKVAA